MDLVLEWDISFPAVFFGAFFRNILRLSCMVALVDAGGTKSLLEIHLSFQEQSGNTS